MSTPASATVARRTRRGYRERPVSQPMLERDEGLVLAHLEHDITEMLAVLEQRVHCAQLSAFLDGLERTDRVYGLVSR